MKIIVFGDGWISRQFASRFSGEAEVVQTDASDPQAVAKILAEKKPDAVLNGAALTGSPNIDWCETHQVETAVANTVVPIVLAKACGEIGAHLVHLGTGDVFEGESPDPKGWKETDMVCPGSYYAKSKAAADLVLADMLHVAVLRLRLPIDETPSTKNLITKIASYATVLDTVQSVTVLSDLLDAIYHVAQKRASGIFHAVQPEPLAYRDLLRWYAEIVAPSTRLPTPDTVDNGGQTKHQAQKLVTQDELLAQGKIAKKRSDAILQNLRLAEIGIKMRPTEEAVKECLEKYKKSL